MDPTTTLFTFMLETHPSVRTVRLVGSWDNFSRTYSMERDSRRDHGQWKGCHTFQDIICDGDEGAPNPKRNGGLKMGQTYYFYYELDGSTETHDPSLPSTSACPYLPGQTVNTLHVPMQQNHRHRSASESSLRYENLRTMKPEDKYVNPQPAQGVPAAPAPRLTASALQPRSRRATRSVSPQPNPQPASTWSWSPRRLFGSRKTSVSSGSAYERLAEVDVDDDSQSDSSSLGDEQSMSSFNGSPASRDLNPESLRKFLSREDQPLIPDLSLPDCPPTERPAAVPEKIAEENEEEDEDDDNFASFVGPESEQPTSLSPPPPSRSRASSVLSNRSAFKPSTSLSSSPRQSPPLPPRRKPEAGDNTLPGTVFVYSPEIEEDWRSPQSPAAADDLPSFYYSDDDEEDDDDALSSRDGDGASLPTSWKPLRLFAASQAKTGKNGNVQQHPRHPGYYQLPSSSNGKVPPPKAGSGLVDLTNDLGWMAEAIENKDH